MTPRKVLFAYDGSACANEALGDIERAGFPSELDLLVVSVAEVWVLETEGDVESGNEDTPLAHGRAISARAQEGLDRARVFARHAADEIGTRFPVWTVDTRVYPDSPTWGVLRAADEWKPDLILLGSHGRSALGRVLLGSVSQKVLSEADCSVRIARHRDYVNGSPVRLLVGVDGTPDSSAAVDAIAARAWPAGSSVKVLAVVGPIGLLGDPVYAYNLAQLSAETMAERWSQMERVVDDAVSKLRAAGILADGEVREGAPTSALLDEAEELGAECIFLGARGHRFMERFLLGSVSAAVAARAGCSVEVVRTPREKIP